MTSYDSLWRTDGFSWVFTMFLPWHMVQTGHANAGSKRHGTSRRRCEGRETRRRCSMGRCFGGQSGSDGDISWKCHRWNHGVVHYHGKAWKASKASFSVALGTWFGTMVGNLLTELTLSTRQKCGSYFRSKIPRSTVPTVPSFPTKASSRKRSQGRQAVLSMRPVSASKCLASLTFVAPCVGWFRKSVAPFLGNAQKTPAVLNGKFKWILKFYLLILLVEFHLFHPSSATFFFRTCAGDNSSCWRPLPYPSALRA